MYQMIAAVWNNPDFGPSTARPTANLTTGQFFFDTTLGYPVWYLSTSTTKWVNAAGDDV
jgi:hypothetical protein